MDSCQRRARLRPGGGRWPPTLQACGCSLVASPGQSQACKPVRVCCAPARARRHLCPVPPPPGLLFSLTQVTFQPFCLPSFSALPFNSANQTWAWVVREGGSVPPPSQGSPRLLTPFLLPFWVSPTSTLSAAAGTNLVSLRRDLCHVFLWSGCSGRWVRLCTSPPPWQGPVPARRGALCLWFAQTCPVD